MSDVNRVSNPLAAGRVRLLVWSLIAVLSLTTWFTLERLKPHLANDPAPKEAGPMVSHNGSQVRVEPPSLQKITELLEQLAAAESDAQYRTVIEALFATDTPGFRLIVDLLGNRDTDPRIRDAAANAVTAHWGRPSFDPAAQQDLKRLLNDEHQSPLVRAACVVPLVRMNRSDATLKPFLLQAISNDKLDYEIRAQAASIITRQDTKAIPVLIAAAEGCEIRLPVDSPTLIREKRNLFYEAVVYQLSEFDPEGPRRTEVIARLVAAVRDSSSDVKVRALQALGETHFQNVESVSVVHQALHDRSERVRHCAATTLGALHKFAQEAIPDLQVALHDPDKNVEYAAAEALGKFGPVANLAVPDLLDCLEEDPIVSSAAVALAKIAPQDSDVISAIVKLAERGDNIFPATKAIVILGPIGKGAVPAFRKQLKTGGNSDRGWILEALASMGEDAKDALPEVVELLTDPTFGVRMDALETLGSMKGHAAPAVPNLIKSLSDEKSIVIQYAVEALAKIGPAAKPAIPELKRLASQPTFEYSVNQALRKIELTPNNGDR